YLMDSLWYLLNTSPISELRWALYRLYLSLYGRSTPTISNPSQREAAIRLTDLVKHEKLFDRTAAKRRIKAHRMLKEKRLRRAFGSSSLLTGSGVGGSSAMVTAAAGTIIRKQTGSSSAAAKAHLIDDDEFVDMS